MDEIIDYQVITLAQSLDLIEAAELKAGFDDIGQVPVKINASATRFVGTHCAQILISAAAYWEESGIPFEVVEPSDEFSQGLKQLGINQVENFILKGKS
jgi:anti-anti-sigma regulatory factor